MSVDPGSSTSPVYVRLLNEGTVVYRPAEAVLVGLGAARLLAPPDYDPEDEEWEFKPGSVVRIEGRTLEGKEVSVAVALAE
jgi:hypothetical protein